MSESFVPANSDMDASLQPIHHEKSYSATDSQDSALETLMVTGSFTRQELAVTSSVIISDSEKTADLERSPCKVCMEAVGLDLEGNEFVPCECAFPICRPCYEYIRAEEGGLCPQCNHRYKRCRGSPPAPGDIPQEFLAHLEEKHEISELEKHKEKDKEPEKLRDNSIPIPVDISPEDVALATAPSIPQRPSQPEDILSTSSGTGSSETAMMALQVLDPNKSMAEYGYGSVVWVGHRREKSQKPGSPEPPDSNDGAEILSEPPIPLEVDDTRRPLSRILPVPPSLLNPYRFLLLVRLGVMLAFFHFRISNPNPKAYPLWLASVICEIWFGISWIFDAVPKWSPVTRETYLQRLSLRYEAEGQPNTLPNVDVFVSTADPEKEPPLVTANVLLSVLAVDYPVDKVACYLSDDGAAMVTFEALSETANFARLWVPFCRKYNIEPRAPEMFFSQRVDYLKGQILPDFVAERRKMKREYDEFKVRLNSLVQKSREVPRDGWRMPDGTFWPGNNRSDHPGMIQVFLQPEGETRDSTGQPLPYLIYVSREKRPDHEHNKKAGAMNALMRTSALITNAPFLLNLDCDHYINNSKALREAVCFLADPLEGSDVCYVQFPQRFDGVDRNDRYANHNTVFFDVNMKGLDGIQGPMYVGTGCVFRRQALYGFNPSQKQRKKKPKQKNCCLCWPFPSTRRRRMTQEGPENANLERSHEEEFEDLEERLTPENEHIRRFGLCYNFIQTTFDTHGGRMATEDPREVLSDVILVISCGFEDSTEWGKTCGWMYGSVTEDIVTGYVMHSKGWHSVYCMPSRPAFKGSAPINMTDRLAQVLRWATGSVEIFFSSHNPLWDNCFSRLNFLQRIAYINTALYPFTSLALVVYCILPAIGLFANQFIVQTITNWTVLYFLCLFVTIFATALLEIRWSGISLEEWWRNEQFWVIGGTSAHLAAVLQGLLKVLAGVEVRFTLTAKANEGEDEMAELYTVRWTWLFLVPLTIVIVNCFAILTGFARAFNNSQFLIGQLVGQVFFSAWVLLHLYPFMKGLMGRSQKTPTILIVWAMLLAIALSLLFADIGLD